jgi:hypothetical protein
MSASTWVVVYNSGEHAQVVDEDGRTCYPSEFSYAKRSQVKHYIDEGLLIVTDMAHIGDDAVPAARMARDEAQKRNEEIDAEKAEAAKQSQKTAASASKAKDNADPKK